MVSVDNDSTKVVDSQYKSHNATIKSVAALAGVSTATVSRVLNNRGYLSDEVKQKVSEAMKELNYQPNDLARSLHLRKSNIIGLIVPSVAHPFFGEITQYIEYYAHSKGYRLLVGNSLGDKAIEQEYIYYLKRSQVEGVILGSHLLETEDYLKLGIPVCSLNKSLGESVPYICCDNYLGGGLATRHLISLGCKKLLYIGGCHDPYMLRIKRKDAFIETCRETGTDYVCCELPDCYRVSTNDGEFLRDVLEKNPDCDGIFAVTDVIAAALVNLATSMNRRVPDDLKIVGFDGGLVSTLMYPGLSSIRQPIDKICDRAVDYLIRQINGDTVPSQTMLPVTLVERGSSGQGQGRFL